MRLALPACLMCVFASPAVMTEIHMTRRAQCTEPASETKINFNREIRPILSEYCFTCHGPDANMLKAGLRLDRRESVFQPVESGNVAVVPGSLDSSELVRRITSSDADEVMPPSDADKHLSHEQIELLKRWVATGGEWSDHWSFIPIERPEVPALQLLTTQRDNQSPANAQEHQQQFDEFAVRNPIDAFVAARLIQEGLNPSAEESKERLIRRVSLDLTGLPPTPDEVREFVADHSDNAFQKVVDRLLGNEHFGERLAIQWLDLARYGDTSGYHNDSLRDMWLWREWVIRAFNSNMPFDQFTIEQIAGDLLPGATVQQQVASGFHRNHMTSDEGGLIDAEYRNLYVVDRVGTTGVAWLGMTIGCAQCHDHKYDPVTQRDFYGIYAFFNNVPENGKDGVRDRNPKPFLRVMDETQTEELRRRERELSETTSQLDELSKSLTDKQVEWEASVVAGEALPDPPGPMHYFALDGSTDGRAPSGDAIIGGASSEPTYREGSSGQAIAFNGKGGIDYADAFDFEKDQAFSVSAMLKVDAKGGSPFGRMETSAATRGWDVEFHGLRPSVHLIHQWPEDSIHIQAEEDVTANQWTHLAFTYDGSGKANGVVLYINGIPAKTSVKQDKLTGTIKTAAPFSIGRRGGAAAAFHGEVDELRIYGRALDKTEVVVLGSREALSIAKIAAEQRTQAQKDQLEKFFRRAFSPEHAELEAQLARLRKSKEEFENALPNTMVMAEMEQPRETFIKLRGNYDQDGERVVPAVPAFLPQLAPRSDGKPLNRLDLARWLVSDEHPLTARVTVNRLWALLMGTGLVKTLNDFGSQGERPSHPELLEWLAADFKSDWDVKRAIRQIVLSSTYRQRSATSPELLARDSENRLLARGPRQRLDAELIRDNALAIAGILNPAIGGKSIKPAQPEGTWEINEMSGYKYTKSTGADLYRRGLYVYWRRSTVYPSFVTLDAPTREFCVAQRAKTSTPLQSLVLMNDPVFVEAARALAQRILAEAPKDNAARLNLIWRLALAREPTAEELSILNQTLDSQLQIYRQDTAAAKQLVNVGDLPKPEAADDSELAAWTALSNVILNLNETISN